MFTKTYVILNSDVSNHTSTKLIVSVKILPTTISLEHALIWYYGHLIKIVQNYIFACSYVISVIVDEGDKYGEV